MGKKILILTSLLITSLAILLASDLVTTTTIYNNLDTVALTVASYIAKNGGINDSIKNYVKKEADANIYCTNEDCKSVKVGDTYFYVVEKEFTPIIISKNNSTVRVKRSVIITLI